MPFQKQYGKTALPVESESQVIELGHLGIKGVKLPWGLQSILSAKLGGPKANIAKLKMNARHTFEYSDLTEDEQSNLTRAQDILRKALVANHFTVDMADRIHIVEFNDLATLGTYSAEDRMTRLARSVLQKTSSTLRVMIHEVAHQSGPDGTKQHENAIGNLTESALSILLGE